MLHYLYLLYNEWGLWRCGYWRTLGDVTLCKHLHVIYYRTTLMAWVTCSGVTMTMPVSKVNSCTWRGKIIQKSNLLQLNIPTCISIPPLFLKDWCHWGVHYICDIIQKLSVSSSQSLLGALEHLPKCSPLRFSLIMLEPVLMLRGKRLMPRIRFFEQLVLMFQTTSIHWAPSLGTPSIV